jgi:AcrR family transcriptional regulator
MPRIGLDLNTLLQAAVELADQQGLEAVTLTSLAQKLGIRPPSLYNHVSGLQGLRSKLAVHGLQQLYARLTHACVGKSGDDAVLAFAETYMAFAKSHPGLYEATLRAAGADDKEMGKAGSEIVDLILRVMQAYQLEGEAAIHIVRGFRSLLHGFASLEQKGGFGIPLDLDVSVRLALDTFLAGIHAMKNKNAGV